MGLMLRLAPHGVGYRGCQVEGILNRVVMRKRRMSVRWLVCVLMLATASRSLPAQVAQNNPPRVFLVDARRLAQTKRGVLAGDKTFDAALKKLEADAKKA